MKTENRPACSRTEPGGKSASADQCQGYRCALSLTALLLILFTILSPVKLWAGPREPAALSLLKFGTGMLTAYALHETGHAVAAKLTNTDIEWGVGTYNQPLGFKENADNDTDGMILLVRGMMAWNVLNPIIYALDYWAIRRTNREEGNYYQGDLEGFEHYSDNTSANLFAATMAGLAVYQGYRFVKTQSWAPAWMKRKGIDLAYDLREDRGFQLAVRIDF
ncbi:MAG: hypothetical protein P8X55_07195 [Desulfosarcinaceae bacterium]